MSRVAFLGLGLMGQRMALRILRAGHRLTVWDLEEERRRPLLAEGAAAAPTPMQAVGGAEFVISMLADPPALEGVLFGAEGAAGNLSAGSAILEMSTVGPAALERTRPRLPAEVALVDAPVLGSLAEAEAGALTIMVGAGPSDFERVAPLLAALGSPRRVGGPGAGASLKLAVNLSLGATISALGEALGLAAALGVEEGVAMEVLAGSPWGGLLRSRRAMLESGEFPPMLRLGLAVKDLRLIRDAAEAVGTPAPVAGAALAWLERALATFGADVDFAAVVAQILRESRSGAGVGDRG